MNLEGEIKGGRGRRKTEHGQQDQGFLKRVFHVGGDCFPTPLAMRGDRGATHFPSTESEVRSLEFTVVGVDAHGSVVSEATDTPRNFMLGTMQSTPIQLELQMKGSEVRFDLYYQYQSPEPESGVVSRRDGVPLARLVADRPVLLAQGTNRLMVRDVCSETLHRAH